MPKITKAKTLCPDCATEGTFEWTDMGKLAIRNVSDEIHYDPAIDQFICNICGEPVEVIEPQLKVVK